MPSDSDSERWQPRADEFLVGTHEKGRLPEDGRIVLPKSSEAHFGGDWFLSERADGEVRLYPEAFWRRLALGEYERHEGNRSDPKVKRFFSRVTPVSVDGSGRLILPKELREEKALSSAIILVGCGSYFEVQFTRGTEEADQGGRGQS